MPLPANSILSLQGHSRPGDTVHSKPKQAMIVRMSAETLEALEVFPQQPQMDFEFGINPGIYIGDTFFPMRPLKEGTPHELYLRASSAAKPMAPLKLYANVTGKFTVERELGEKVQDRIRESTLGAVKQRSERKTILIDTPADLHLVNGKKRKAPASMFRKPVQQSDHVRSSATASSSALPARVASPVPSQKKTKEGLIPVRNRLIHYLAVSERTSEEVIRLVGGSDCDASLRREVLGLLDELAEQTAPMKKSADKSPRLWRLKPQSWLEVRPYEWPKLTDPERTTMARVARLAYKNLNIPETDPAWHHVRYRNGANPAHRASPPSAGSSRTNAMVNGTLAVVAKTDAPKRGVTSKEAKEKKTKPKPKAEVLMKDESRRPSSRVSNTSLAQEDPIMNGGSRTSTGKAVVTVRRAPGSGFKAVKPTSQDGDSDGVGGPSPPHGTPIEVRTKEKEPPPPSLPAKPMLSMPSSVGRERKSGGESAPPTRVKKLIESTAGGTDSERERGKDREGGKERDKDRHKGRNDTAGLKRKKPLRDEDDFDAPLRSTVQKRRKTDEPILSLSDSRTKDLTLPEKPDLSRLPPRPRVSKKEQSPNIKKDASPLLPRKSLPSHAKTSSVSSIHSNLATSKANGSTKSRRRSPIYTSSEDEAEIRPSNMHDPTPGSLTTGNTHSHSQPRPHLRVHSSRPLPTDHAALRARYHSSYVQYITTFQQVVMQRGKIESMLTGNGSGSVGSITDSDDELMDAESLSSLSAEHRRLQGELESIQRIFSRCGDGGSGSD